MRCDRSLVFFGVVGAARAAWVGDVLPRAVTGHPTSEINSLLATHSPLRRATSSFETSISAAFSTAPATGFDTSFSDSTSFPESTFVPTATATATTSPTLLSTNDASISSSLSGSGSAAPSNTAASQASSSGSSITPYAHSLLVVVIILSIALFALVIVIAVLMLRKRRAKAKYIEVSELSAPVAVTRADMENHRPYSYASSTTAESNPFIPKEEPRGRGTESRRTSISSISRYSQ